MNDSIKHLKCLVVMKNKKNMILKSSMDIIKLIMMLVGYSI